MKINWAVFKKGKPVYWIVGAVVVFVVFYMIASKGSGAAKSSGASAGGVTTISTGPSDAQISAAAGISAAQIQANATVAQGQLALAAQKDGNAAGVAVASLGAQVDMASIIASSETALGLGRMEQSIQLAGITAQQNISQINAEYSFATARVAAETNLATTQIQADMVNNSFATQERIAQGQNATTIALSNNQTKAFIAASALNSVLPVDRDNIAAIILADGNSLKYTDRGSGSFVLN